MRFSDLPERVAAVHDRIAEAVKRGGHGQVVRLVAVTKTHGPEAVEAVARAGLHDVAENKVQEALGKQEALTASGSPAASLLRWHLIGHLQTNKAKSLRRFSLFHALDRDGLLEAADKVGRSAGGGRVPVLVQVNVSGEATKGGYAVDARTLGALATRLHAAKGLDVRGVMTMAPFDADERVLRAVFGGARAAREMLRRSGLAAEELSMGMSGDYEVAVEEGATIVRLGTVLFGSRS
jgi:pyridoxal phosphate enzyme (YggS family)